MWRPRTLGSIIAERRLRLGRPRRRATVVSVKFGRPIRSPRPQRGDPWWCPIQITGLGKRRLQAIAGEDSLQALILALEFVSHILPLDAERAGGHLEWLGERERLVFANTLSTGLLSHGLQNCIKGLADAVDVLENGNGERGPAKKKVIRRLKALIASGGYTSDPRRVPPPSNKTMQGDGPSGRR